MRYGTVCGDVSSNSSNITCVTVCGVMPSSSSNNNCVTACSSNNMCVTVCGDVSSSSSNITCVTACGDMFASTSNNTCVTAGGDMSSYSYNNAYVTVSSNVSNSSCNDVVSTVCRSEVVRATACEMLSSNHYITDHSTVGVVSTSIVNMPQSLPQPPQVLLMLALIRLLPVIHVQLSPLKLYQHAVLPV